MIPTDCKDGGMEVKSLNGLSCQCLFVPRDGMCNCETRKNKYRSCHRCVPLYHSLLTEMQIFFSSASSKELLKLCVLKKKTAILIVLSFHRVSTSLVIERKYGEVNHGKSCNNRHYYNSRLQLVIVDCKECLQVYPGGDDDDDNNGDCNYDYDNKW